MRRTTTVVLVATVLLVLLAAAAALADTITCSPGSTSDNPCWGTNGDDTLTGTTSDDVMYGGPGYGTAGNGDDTFDDLAGNDRISAIDAPATATTPATTPLGTPGNDTTLGGPGNDTIAANDGSPDDISCGTGRRDIVYSDKGGDTVSGDCEWRRSYDIPQACPAYQVPWTDSSKPGGGSDVWPQQTPYPSEKIIWCIDGTPRNDKNLVGTTDLDLFDSIFGSKGDDKLSGRLGYNFLEGWTGNDILKGGPGTDYLFGDSSCNPQPDDCNYLQPGHGFKGAGEDKIYGGPGNDAIGAIEGPDSKSKPDTIRCGGGNDIVQYDEGIDKVAKDCEEKWTRGEDALWIMRGFGHRHRH